MQRELFRFWSNFGYGTNTIEKHDSEDKEYRNQGSKVELLPYENLFANPLKMAAACWGTYSEYTKAASKFFENNMEVLKENTKPFVEWYASAISIWIPPR